jgi:hypothetical protein
MLDEYEIKLQQKHRVFAEVKESNNNPERRGSERRKESTTRRRLQERREKSLAVENERRKEQRRISERRSFEDRRVTSDYSHQKLLEERAKIDPKNRMNFAFKAMFILFLGIASLIVYIAFR